MTTIGAQEGWCADDAKVTYRRWFQQGLEPGVNFTVSDSLREIGQEPDRVLALARGEAVGLALQTATGEAGAFGVLGAPSFAVGREIFWGHDRLDDQPCGVRPACRGSRIDRATDTIDLDHLQYFRLPDGDYCAFDPVAGKQLLVLCPSRVGR